MTLPWTALELEVIRSWDMFLRRNALLRAGGALGLVFPGSLSIRFKAISETVDALLYIDAVSIFDASTETRLGEDDFARLANLGRRLTALRDRGLLLDYDALNSIRMRRNQLGHEAVGGVVPTELDAMVGTLQHQLEAWGLVRPPGAGYSFFLERSEARPTDRPDTICEWEYEIGVKRQSDGVKMLTFHSKEYLGKTTE